MATPSKSIRVGGEIDAACNKCELNLAHTILAMVGTKVIRVQCNTCRSQHQYRGEQPMTKSVSFGSKPSAARAPRAPTKVIGWEEQLKGKDVSRAKKYSARDTYAIDQVIDHPSFGLGIVTAVRGDKVDVSFKTFEKTLVHGKTPPPSATDAA